MNINEFNKAIAGIPGLLPGSQPETLFLASQSVDGPRLEIGSLVGASTCSIAMGMKQGDLLICLDIFDGYLLITRKV